MNTLDRLKSLIHDKFGIALEAMDPYAPFASYELDSLTVAELMFEIDDEFHVVIPDDAATSVTNLDTLARLIDQLLEPQRKAA